MTGVDIITLLVGMWLLGFLNGLVLRVVVKVWAQWMQ